MNTAARVLPECWMTMKTSRRDFLRDNLRAATTLGSAMALGGGFVAAQEARAAAARAASARRGADIPEWTPAPPFPVSEHEQRIHRLKQAMQREKLDAVLIYSQHSMYYLFGYDVMSGAAIAYQVIIVPLDGDPVALVRNTMVGQVSQSPFLGKDVRHYTESFAADVVRMTTDILAEKRLLRGRKIGIETRSLTLNAHDYEVVRQGVAAGGGELVDASELVAELRMRKSATELDYLRCAGRLTDVMLEAAYAAMRPGVRGCEVEAEALRAVYSAGSDDMAQPLYIVPGSAGNNTSQAFSRRRLRRGEAFILEGGACYNRYNAVGGYPAFCGAEPDREIRRVFASARESVDAGREVLRAGLPVADLAKAMAVNQQKGAEGFHGGYGIGIGYRYLWHEAPIIRPSDRHVLEAGMVLSLFGFGASDDGLRFLFLAEPVIVTETGLEDLSRLPRSELRVVGG